LSKLGSGQAVLWQWLGNFVIGHDETGLRLSQFCFIQFSGRRTISFSLPIRIFCSMLATMHQQFSHSFYGNFLFCSSQFNTHGNSFNLKLQQAPIFELVQSLHTSNKKKHQD